MLTIIFSFPSNFYCPFPLFHFPFPFLSLLPLPFASCCIYFFPWYFFRPALSSLPVGFQCFQLAFLFVDPFHFLLACISFSARVLRSMAVSSLPGYSISFPVVHHTHHATTLQHNNSNTQPIAYNTVSAHTSVTTSF